MLLSFGMSGFAQNTQTFDFEDNAIPAGWTNDASHPWIVTSTSEGSGHAGTYCIKSGNSGVASSTSTLSATFTFLGEGTISFLGGIYGEGTSTIYDHCIFKIDGVEQFNYGALASWQTYSFDVTAGTHTFEWSYTKDGSVNPTGDAFFVDNVVVDLGDPNACPKPVSISHSSVTSNSVEISWIPSVGTSGWEVFCGTATDDPATAAWTSVPTDTFYTFSNLDANVAYTAYVRTVCANGTSVPRSTSFTTLPIPATLPYSSDFTNDTDNSQWVFSTTCHNHFTIGSGTSYDGGNDQAVYVSNDSIGTYAADSISGFLFAERTIDFGETPGTYIISLDWKASGNISGTSIYSGLIAYLRDANEETPSSMPSYVNSYLQYAVLDNDWVHQEIQVDDVTGLKKLQLFTWGYTNSSALQVPAAFDNVSVTEASCVTPEFTVTTTDVTATVTWDGDPSGTYLLTYREAGAPASTNVYETITGDTTFTITGLTPVTTYYAWVAQICGGDTSVSTFAHSFTTTCPSSYPTPFSENFNAASSVPECWELYSGLASSVFAGGDLTSTTGGWVFSSTDVFGAYHPKVNIYGDRQYWLVSPAIDLSNLTNPTLTFDLALTDYANSSPIENPNGQADDKFMVIISTDTGATWSAANAIVWGNDTTADHSYNQISTTGEEVTISLAAYAGQTVKIAFYGESTVSNGDNDLHIDNVMVAEASSCAKPTGLTAAYGVTDTIVLSWTDPNGNLWDLMYGPAGFDPDSADNNDNIVLVSGLTETTYTVTELPGGQSYDFYVRSDCGGEVSYWSNPTSASPYTLAMGITGSDTVTGCGFTVTDDGGPNGLYSNSCNSTLTIYPSEADSLVTISGIFAGESSLDYLKIYDGTTTNESNLLEQISASNLNVSSGVQASFGPITSESGPLTLLFHSDGSVVYDGFVANVSCVAAPSCVKPNTFSISDLSIDEATLTWNENTNASGYNVVISTQAGFNPDTCSDVLTSGTNSYTFTGLQSGTNYYVCVQADCGGGDLSDWSNVTNFVTLAGLPATLPYVCGFNDPDENSAWMLVNGNQTNKWYFGMPSNETDSVLFISNNGTTESYTISSSSNVWAYRDIQFGDMAEFSVDIKWKGYGESCCDYLKVFFGIPASVEASSSTTPTNATYNSGSLNVQSSWQHLTFSLDGSYANTVQRLYLLWHNDGSVGTDPAAVIDSIVITGTNCGKPYNLDVANITTTTADFTFTAAMSTDNEWEYAICTGNETADNAAISGPASDTAFSVSNLTPGTTYTAYVRTACDVDEYSAWSAPITFTTICVETTIPIVENFDSLASSSFPNCWTRHSTYGEGYPYVNASYSTSGTKSLYFYCGPSTYTMAVLPPFDATTNPVNSLQISFNMRVYYSTANMMVGVMSDPNDPTTFVAVDTLQPTVTEAFDYYLVSFANYAGNGEYVALKTLPTGSNYCSYYIDDLVLETIPSCPKPLHVTVSSITQTTASIAWEEMGSATAWNIKLDDGTNETIVAANSNPFTVSNLTTATAYTVSVQADCSAGDQSEWSGTTAFSTACDAIQNFPYTEDFENSGNMPICWSQEYVSGSVDWEFQAGDYSWIDTAHSGNYNALFYYGSNSTNYQTKLVSPVFDLTNVTDPMLSYWHAQAIWSSDQDQLTVYYRTSPTGEWTQLQQFTSSITDWTQETIALPSPSATYQIAFEGYSSYGYGVVIDDVRIAADDDTSSVITNPTVATNAASAIEQTTATLNATITNPDNVTITAKGFEWKATTGGTYTQIAGTGTGNNFTANLTGLTANTGYTFRAFITFNGQTVTGNEMTFTTQNQDVEPCDVPTGVTVSAVTDESITITWNNAAGVNSWNIQYRPVGGTLSSATSNTNSYTINGLQPETTYEIQVQANCGGGNLSEWSSAVTGTTTVGIDSWLANSVSLYPNPAKEYVDIRVDGDLNVKTMEVYDVYGKLLNTVIVTENPTRINISGLANGMYFVRVTTEEGMVTKTFVKK